MRRVLKCQESGKVGTSGKVGKFFNGFVQGLGLPGIPSNNFANNLGSLVGSIGQLTSMNSGINGTSLAFRDAITQGLSNVNPLLGGIAGAANMLTGLTGVGDISRSAGLDAGISSGAISAANTINALPGVGLIGGLFSGSKTDRLAGLSDEGEDVLSSVSGVQSAMNSAGKLARKKFAFGIGRNKANDYITKTNSMVDTTNQLAHISTLGKSSVAANRSDISQNNINKTVGSNVRAVGKRGMKLLSKSQLQEILSLQKGGVIGTDTNLLPEGQLHARLNHLDEINPDLEDATKKGIPVLDESGEQVAEIERDELIFRLELTKKIEKLMKDGSDEAMIEAGKLITFELIDNTQDNTGKLMEDMKND